MPLFQQRMYRRTGILLIVAGLATTSWLLPHSHLWGRWSSYYLLYTAWGVSVPLLIGCLFVMRAKVIARQMEAAEDGNEGYFAGRSTAPTQVEGKQVAIHVARFVGCSLACAAVFAFSVAIPMIAIYKLMLFVV